MSVEREGFEDERISKQRDRERKYREHIARVQRRERLHGCAKEVRLIYQSLRHRAEQGSAEWTEFDRLWRHHSDIEKGAALLSQEEQDRILEDFPKLAAQLRIKYGL